jgi:signal transduction histidine kinase
LLAAVYLAAIALASRLLFSIDPDLLPWYVGLLAIFFVIFSLIWLWPRLPPSLLHLIFGLQCLVVIFLLALDTEFDYVTIFFALLAYQAAVVFRGRTRWIWVVTLIVAIGVSLMIAKGFAAGLSQGLTNMAVAMALAALAIAGQEIEAARSKNVEMVGELERTNSDLRKFAAEVEQLAALRERNRLARELHDSVSQAMFSILLAARSAQMMRTRDPEAVPAQLELVQELAKDALGQMRAFIADLRPRS